MEWIWDDDWNADQFLAVIVIMSFSFWLIDWLFLQTSFWYYCRKKDIFFFLRRKVDAETALCAIWLCNDTLCLLTRNKGWKKSVVEKKQNSSEWRLCLRRERERDKLTKWTCQPRNNKRFYPNDAQSFKWVPILKVRFSFKAKKREKNIDWQ